MYGFLDLQLSTDKLTVNACMLYTHQEGKKEGYNKNQVGQNIGNIGVTNV